MVAERAVDLARHELIEPASHLLPMRVDPRTRSSGQGPCNRVTHQHHEQQHGRARRHGRLLLSGSRRVGALGSGVRCAVRRSFAGHEWECALRDDESGTVALYIDQELTNAEAGPPPRSGARGGRMPTRGYWPVRRGSAFTLRLNGPRASDARGVLRGRPLHARRRIRGLHPSARPDPPVRGPEPLRKRHQSAVQRHGYPGRSHHLPPLGVHPPATCGWSRGGQRPRRHPWRARPVHGPRRCGSVRPRGGRRPGGARRSATPRPSHDARDP